MSAKFFFEESCSFWRIPFYIWWNINKPETNNIFPFCHKRW